MDMVNLPGTEGGSNINNYAGALEAFKRLFPILSSRGPEFMAIFLASLDEITDKEISEGSAYYFTGNPNFEPFEEGLRAVVEHLRKH